MNRRTPLASFLHGQMTPRSPGGAHGQPSQRNAPIPEPRFDDHIRSRAAKALVVCRETRKPVAGDRSLTELLLRCY